MNDSRSTIGRNSTNRWRGLRWSLFAILLATVGVTAPAAALVNTAGEWDADWPMSEAFLETFDGASPQQLTEYELDVVLDPDSAALRGSLQTTFKNHTGRPQAMLPFRLYPNASYYGDGDLSVSEVVVDGQSVAPSITVDGTVLEVPLGRLLPADKKTVIEIAFETIVPADSGGSFGIFSRDTMRETWILADWYPIVAGWDSDTGWGLDPPTIWGDPTFSEASVYDVRLTVPAGMSVVSTGETVEVHHDGALDTLTITSGPVREFAMVVDDQFQTLSADANGAEVRLHLNGDLAPGSGATEILQSAADALDAFGSRYGLYPYRELDIVQTDLASALGVSWSGVIFVDANSLEAIAAGSGDPTGLLLFTLIHEIGHQWWGSTVGVNSNDHGFLNESLTNYLTVVAISDIAGAGAARTYLDQSIAGGYLALLRSGIDGIVDRPIEEAASITDYARLVYGKGALGFLAIRLEIGDEPFFAALQTYVSDHSFGLASPADLLDAFEATSGYQLEPLWIIWFESAVTTASDVQQLLDRVA